MKKVDSILWRNYNKATVDTLTGTSGGQYDIRLGSKNNFDIFLIRNRMLTLPPMAGMRSMFS